MTDFERLVAEIAKRHRNPDVVAITVLNALDAIGCQVVPKVATTDMISRGYGAYRSRILSTDAFKVAYTAMLAAAPKLEADNG